MKLPDLERFLRDLNAAGVECILQTNSPKWNRIRLGQGHGSLWFNKKTGKYDCHDQGQFREFDEG